jgi:hypothetical protein
MRFKNYRRQSSYRTTETSKRPLGVARGVFDPEYSVIQDVTRGTDLSNVAAHNALKSLARPERFELPTR